MKERINYYLKVNQRVQYTYLNTVKWLEAILGRKEGSVYIVCDNIQLRSEIEDILKNISGRSWGRRLSEEYLL